LAVGKSNTLLMMGFENPKQETFMPWRYLGGESFKNNFLAKGTWVAIDHHELLTD
jgi:hypothetical protein